MNKSIYFLFFLCVACSQKENTQPQEYEGPLQEAEHLEMLYTEHEMIKVKMRTPLLYEFKNNDREFPKGVNLEFYDVNGKLSSTLRADHAYYFKNEDKWRARGKVQVVNIEKNEQLDTEELFWFPAKEIINTEKFVTITTPTQIIYGDGLESNQNFSEYKITNIKGMIGVTASSLPL